jgi:2-polyprenyl-3-methyl-5-hydroxy-6-metoxy-1,4-benzoquinol methylase
MNILYPPILKLFVFFQCIRILNVKKKLNFKYFNLFYKILFKFYNSINTGIYHDYKLSNNFYIIDIIPFRLRSALKKRGIYNEIFILIKKKINLVKVKNILDIGCSEGFYAVNFALLKKKVYAVDQVQDHLNRAKIYSDFFDVNKEIIFINNDFRRISSEIFHKSDLILLFGVLYHLKNIKRDFLFLFSFNKPILLESTFVDFKKDNLENHIDGPICFYKFKKFLDSNNIRFKLIKDYNNIVNNALVWNKDKYYRTLLYIYPKKKYNKKYIKSRYAND